MPRSIPVFRPGGGHKTQHIFHVNIGRNYAIITRFKTEKTQKRTYMACIGEYPRVYVDPTVWLASLGGVVTYV